MDDRSENELFNVTKAKALRALALTRDYSSVYEQVPGELLSLGKLPPSNFPVTSLIHQFIDSGRANSVLKPSKSLVQPSFFQDFYHRDALQEENRFSLAKQSCIREDLNQSYLIPVSACLNDIIELFAFERGYEIHNLPIHFNHLNEKEIIFFVRVPKEDIDDALHTLGILGALTNRDYQIKIFFSQIRPPTPDLHRLLYLKRMQNQSLDKHDPITINTRPLKTRQDILNQISLQEASCPLGYEQEQRRFYFTLLKKIISAITCDVSTDRSYLVQSSAALSRIELMLNPISSLSYPNFLRTIDACMDEIIILLILESTQKPKSASEIAAIVRKFIMDTVGEPPQLCTFRSSAMQGILSCLQMALRLNEDRPKKLLITAASYYEILDALTIIYDIRGVKHDSELKLEVSLTGAKVLPSEEKDIIYDVIFAAFESNILKNKKHIVFTDINDLVEKQIALRKDINDAPPLMVIVDNTMSDFKEIYLPLFLLQFEQEIEKGQLCVLITHSGNKFIHMGTDKGCAALLYGYYNPSHFRQIAEETQREMASNTLGDFKPNAPTILLTSALMDCATNEILEYGPLLRQRTQYLYHKIIPKELSSASYYSIADPSSDATYKGLPVECATLRNSCTFISIKADAGNYLNFAREGKDFKYILYENLDALLEKLNLLHRDGFGFSETTCINIHDQEDLFVIKRISIGTEALDSLSHVFSMLCDYLIQINKLMEKYNLSQWKDRLPADEFLNTEGAELFLAVDSIFQASMEKIHSSEVVLSTYTRP